jgi:BirA family biotin operon repressor/biotin-[acetyl-CoA-carboxylase] ligase
MENRLLGILNKELKFSFNTEIFEEAVSTNDYCKNLAKSSEEDALIIALSQTGGKGRLGRSFYSPENTGVYFSVLLKPDLEIEKAILITTATAVAVTRALGTLGCQNAQIKWVNDIYFDNRKVCGILTESVINTETKKLQFAVLGVGINLIKPESDFPEEIKNIAGAVFQNETEDLKELFVAEFLNEFYCIYKELQKASFMEEYREKCLCLGKKVTVIQGDAKRKATAISVDENARLEVEYENGEREFLSSGEISIKI